MTSAQAYEHIAADGRVLQTKQNQDYGGGTSAAFTSVTAANASGMVANIRIVAIWDVIDAGDPGKSDGTGVTCTSATKSKDACPWQCVAASSTNFINLKVPDNDFSDCADAKMVVSRNSPNDVVYNAMKLRTEMAISYWSSAIKVKPVKDSITIAGGNSALPPLMASSTYTKVVPNADLVIVMTARRASGVF